MRFRGVDRAGSATRGPLRSRAGAVDALTGARPARHGVTHNRPFEPAKPDAAFALAACPGIAFSEASDGHSIRPTVGAAHGYLLDEPEMLTGFVGCGAGFRKGAVAPRTTLECIAPIVAALLGLQFDALDGVFFPGLLTDG